MLLYLYWCSLICLKPGNPAGQDWENRAIGKWSQPHRKGTFSCSLVNISAMIFMSSNSLLLAASGEFSWALSQRTRTETGFTKWAEGMWGMHGLSIIAIVFSVYACILLGIQFCLSQISLETSNKALLDLQEKYQVAITTLKEKELIISKMLFSGKRQLRNWWENFVSLSSYLSYWWQMSAHITENLLIGRAKELRTDLQNASEEINSLYEKLGKIN